MMPVAVLLFALWLPGSVGHSAAPLEPPAQAPDQAEAKPEQVPSGLWPTERMIESSVRRWTLEAARLYELGDEQQELVEAVMLERWSRFLREHRPDLQPLVNEYFEARLAVAPPAREQVEAWASRALPLFEKIQEQIEAGNEDIRPLLTGPQRVEFEAQVREMRAGMEAYGQRIARWRRGQYAEREWWDPPRGLAGQPTTRPAEARPDYLGAALEPPDQIAAELQAWDRYVAEFIALYRLDEGQCGAALSILDEVKQRAIAHRDGYRTEVQDLERQIAASRPENVRAVARELQRLYGPVDQMFRELEERLRRIPTHAQHRAASQPAAKVDK